MPADRSPPATSHDIARKSRSNLAITLSCLPGERKSDMISFYAFCRLLDDIADDPNTPVHERRLEMNRWRQAILNLDRTTHPVLTEVLDLSSKYEIDRSLFLEILDGMASDLETDRFESWDELLKYCYKVASAVGLVSIEIFGYQNPRCREYAVNLGYALQLTNIIRDVGQDARDTGRIYISRDILAAHQVSEDQILSGRYDDHFRGLMQEMHDRALVYFREAESILPLEDRSSMIAAEMMAQVYREILEKVRSSGFRVFEERVSLHPLKKILILSRFLMRRLLNSW
jgi:15-cis-phytoene synthase